MKLKILAAAIFTLIITSGYAQTLRGTVSETGSNTRLTDVFIRNISNKQIALGDSKGNYAIRASAGNTLIFSSPGYVSDTLFLTDLRNKYIQLVPQSIELREVNIRASRKFDPAAEYPEVYSRSKVYPLSPSSYFGKQGRDARRLKHYFVREAQERSIDSAFSRAYVSSLVPLKGVQLEDFMTLYRPTYAFLRNNNAESMAVYINDSYKKYQALPADKKKVPKLVP